jgi:hypothetical protein
MYLFTYALLFSVYADNHNGSIDVPVEDGDTLLHLACLYGHLPCVQVGIVILFSCLLLLVLFGSDSVHLLVVSYSWNVELAWNAKMKKGLSLFMMLVLEVFIFGLIWKFRYLAIPLIWFVVGTFSYRLH